MTAVPFKPPFKIDPAGLHITDAEDWPVCKINMGRSDAQSAYVLAALNSFAVDKDGE